ncbi:hypothetical protein BD289DRAFT_423562 [Coniella lustricola]|uniref:Uncharacterized protein n=1 Tax=Coniella lustricola TaxID=2025994 RepID=A0A2T3AJ96_9PEZI|nr:hypothetical protein BD289DRAFT_423562 [Coniella lustricola]
MCFNLVLHPTNTTACGSAPTTKDPADDTCDTPQTLPICDTPRQAAAFAPSIRARDEIAHSLRQPTARPFPEAASSSVSRLRG